MVLTTAANPPHPPAVSKAAKQAWAEQLDAAWVLFYLKPLLKKWIKSQIASKVSRKQQLRVGVACPARPKFITQLQALPFKAVTLCPVTPLSESPSPTTLDGLILIESDPRTLLTPQRVTSLIQRLEPGGVLVVICPNPRLSLPTWLETLEGERLKNRFIMGFHPQGALAFWPVGLPGWLNGLGVLLQELACLFPGRVEYSRHYAPNWIVTAYRPPEIYTTLTT